MLGNPSLLPSLFLRPQGPQGHQPREAPTILLLKLGTARSQSCPQDPVTGPHVGMWEGQRVGGLGALFSFLLLTCRKG